MTTFTLNGTPLRTFAQRITTGTGQMITAPGVGDNIAVNGLDGAHNPYQLGQQRRPDGEGRFVVELSMKGVDPDTGEWDASTTEQSYLDNCDDMIKRWHARTLTIDGERPDGSVRRMVGHLAPGESLDFTRERSSPHFGTYVAVVAISSGRWTDLAADAVTTGVQTLASGNNLSLAAFAAATAVCTDLEIVIGDGLNPRLDKADGYLQHNGAIASGRELRLFTRTGLVDDGAGTPWTPDYTDLAWGPGPRFFEIDPTQPLEATLTFDGGGTMDVEISGPRHYRTP